MSEVLIKRAAVAVLGQEKPASVTVSAEVPRPWVRVSYGSGNPAGVPDFKPMNPWGRPMPKVDAKSSKPQLWQVMVKDNLTGKYIGIGYKNEDKDVCGALCEKINRNVAMGIEKLWSDAHLVKC